MEGKVRISTAAAILGVHPHYLRLLERQGRIPEACYDRNGRFYTAADLELLRSMGIGNKPRRLKSVDEVFGANSS